MCDKDLENIFDSVEITFGEEAKQNAKARMIAEIQNNNRRSIMQTTKEKNEQNQTKAKFKLTVQHMQGAVAMLLVFALGVSALAITPGVNLFGTSFKGYEDAVEIDIFADPDSIEAATDYAGGTFLLYGINEEDLSQIKSEHVALGGYFENLSVVSAAAEDATLKVVIADNGSTADDAVDWQNYAGGNGLIAISPEAVKDKSRFYQAEVSVIYPELVSETEALGRDYDGVISENITVTLKNDSFTGALNADDITVSGAVDKINISGFTQNDNSVTFTFDAVCNDDFGSAVFSIDGEKLTKGLGVTISLNIGRVPMPIQVKPLLVMNSDTQVLEIFMEYDAFVDDVSLSMLSFGGVMNDFEVVGFEHEDSANLKLTLKGRSEAGTGTVRFDSAAFLSGRNGRVAEITVSEPEISVEQYVPAGADNPFFMVTLSNVESLKQGDVSFSFGGALSGLSITDTLWSGNSVMVYTGGVAGTGSGTISVSGLYRAEIEFNVMDGVVLSVIGEPEPDDETADEPVDETAGEPDDESAGEPDDETVGEPADETAGEPDDESAGEPDDEFAGEPSELSSRFVPNFEAVNLSFVNQAASSSSLDLRKTGFNYNVVKTDIFNWGNDSTLPDFGDANFYPNYFDPSSWGAGGFPATISPSSGGIDLKTAGSLVSIGLSVAKGALKFVGKYVEAEWYQDMLKFLGLGPTPTEMMLAEVLGKLDTMAMQIDTSTGQIMSRLDEINYNVMATSVQDAYNRTKAFYTEFKSARAAGEYDPNNYNRWLKDNVAFPNKSNPKVEQLYLDMDTILNKLNPGYTDSMKTDSLIALYEQKCRSNLPFEHNVYIYMDRYIASWAIDMIGFVTMVQEIETYNLYIGSPYQLWNEPFEEGQVFPGKSNYVSRKTKTLLENYEATLQNLQDYLANSQYTKSYNALEQNGMLFVVTNSPSQIFLLTENKRDYVVTGGTYNDYASAWQTSLCFHELISGKAICANAYEAYSKHYIDEFIKTSRADSDRSANWGGKDAKGVSREKSIIKWQVTRPTEFDINGFSFGLVIQSDINKENAQIQNVLTALTTYQSTLSSKGKGKPNLSSLLSSTLMKMEIDANDNVTLRSLWYTPSKAYTHLYIGNQGSEKARFLDLRATDYRGFSKKAKEVYKDMQKNGDQVAIMMVPG